MKDAAHTSLRIAVVGNPNSGKTTIFNVLTGLRMKVANYPGVTVERREGKLIGTDSTLIDLPGVYSLSARSPDEEIARDVLQGRITGIPAPDAVLIVVDASNLERQLYLATQIIEFGRPVVIALNMIDEAEKRAIQVDAGNLSRLLGVQVVPTVATTRRGIDALQHALASVSSSAVQTERRFALPAGFEEAIAQIAEGLRDSGVIPEVTVRAGALLWLMDYLSGDVPSRRSAERFLSRLAPEHSEMLRREADKLGKALPEAASVAIEARYEWISENLLKIQSVETVGSPTARPGGRSDRIDRIVTHRVLGPAIFAAVMLLLFMGIFAGAEPLMGLIESGQLALGQAISAQLPEGVLRSLLADGVIAGVGAVLSFFPQICFLFLFLGALEDSGYMARAAFIMDRVMAKVGLHGKSFIPLLSSYACAIPGILATRTIEDRRDRFTTIMVAPFMSCSARLPVYLIVVAAVFADRTMLKAVVMFSMYALGTITALVLAMLFKRTLFAGPRPPFIMEMPPYRLPRFSALLRSTWDRSKLFLTNAGTVIVAVCVVVWALSYFPRTDPSEFSEKAQARLATLASDSAGGDVEARAADREQLIASERLRHSYIGRLGKFIEPAIKPLGFDWRIGIGIMTSFLAREVFVGTMGITFAVGQADENSVALRDQLAAATWPDGTLVLTPVTGISLMVFYVLACQCVSTLAVVKKETGSWKWPALMFAYMSVLAYAGSLAVNQIGRMIE